jgi:hypothetical protein
VKLVHVIPLPEPRRLLGQHGPVVIGLMSNSPAQLLQEWLPIQQEEAERCSNLG